MMLRPGYMKQLTCASNMRHLLYSITLHGVPFCSLNFIRLLVQVRWNVYPGRSVSMRERDFFFNSGEAFRLFIVIIAFVILIFIYIFELSLHITFFTKLLSIGTGQIFYKGHSKTNESFVVHISKNIYIYILRLHF